MHLFLFNFDLCFCSYSCSITVPFFLIVPILNSNLICVPVHSHSSRLTFQCIFMSAHFYSIPSFQLICIPAPQSSLLLHLILVLAHHCCSSLFLFQHINTISAHFYSNPLFWPIVFQPISIRTNSCYSPMHCSISLVQFQPITILISAHYSYSVHYYYSNPLFQLEFIPTHSLIPSNYSYSRSLLFYFSPLFQPIAFLTNSYSSPFLFQPIIPIQPIPILTATHYSYSSPLPF